MPEAPLSPADLFVLLEKAFRRRSRRCRSCAFSLPFRVAGPSTGEGKWSLIPSLACSERCRLVLEEVIAEFQAAYRLSDSGRFHALRR